MSLDGGTGALTKLLASKYDRFLLGRSLALAKLIMQVYSNEYRAQFRLEYVQEF